MASLIRVVPGEDPGIRRVRAGTGFRYLNASGDAVSKAERERIDRLVIPPAWEDVWISAQERGHIQAVGTDAAGRRQYVYHPRWRAGRDRRKFVRMLALAEALPRARAQVTTALAGEAIDRTRVLAASFRLLDDAALRIGAARYLARHGSRGLTTLQCRDVRITEAVLTLRFPGKSGKLASIEIDDAQLATVLTALAAGRPRSPLLAYRSGRRRVRIRASEVNTYVGELTGAKFTAKDFRTLHGTIVAAKELSEIGVAATVRERKRAEKRAVTLAAKALGNTPAVAKGSYIDPRVFREYAKGHLLDRDVTAETAIRRLLM